MKPQDLINLTTLGVLWGASFLFIRVATPEFGAIALMEVRVVLAALILLPFVFAHRSFPEIRRHWRPIALMGVMHYAVPFSLFAYSMLTLTGGFAAIINASSPLFAGVIGWLWLGDRPTPTRVAGLLIGFAGVVILVWTRINWVAGPTALAIGAAVTASFCYGFAAVMARKQLAGVSSTAISAGSMMAAALVLLPASLWLWPDASPSAVAWSMAATLGVFATAIAFILYFRLIASIGPGKAITVTFLIPVFAVLFGSLLLDEPVTATMILGGSVILLGTALSTGLLHPVKYWNGRRLPFSEPGV